MNLSELNDLDFTNAGSWPPAIKVLAILFIAAAVGAAGYWFDTRDLLDDLDASRSSEQRLRVEFSNQQRVMANIEAYRTQLQDLRGLLDSMLRQLPTRTEMPDLLEDISNTGKINGLTFELFKPQDEQPRDFYAAKPISIRARANYHQFGAFVSSIAALSRIVTLENATILVRQSDPRNRAKSAAQEEDPDVLLIEATLQTYRYLDEDTEESAEQPAKGRRMARK